MKHAAALGAVTIALSLLCGPLHAQEQVAYTAKSVNMRAGPARDYPIVAVLGPGLQILVQGCLADYSWCDVVYGPSRGWIYAGNINYDYQNTYVPLLSYGPLIGLGIIGFAFDDYWNRYYWDRPFFAQRHRWARHPPPRLHERPAVPVPPVPERGFGPRPVPQPGFGPRPVPRQGPGERPRLREGMTRPQGMIPRPERPATPPAAGPRPVPQPQAHEQPQLRPQPQPQVAPRPQPQPQVAPRPQPQAVPQPGAQAVPQPRPQAHVAPVQRAAPPAGGAPRPQPRSQRQDTGDQHREQRQER